MSYIAKMKTMGIQNRNKLQNLLQIWPPGVIATTKWLESCGISRSLVKKYKTNGWIAALENGAYYKPQDTIEWIGALNALESQLNLAIHIGGRTALEIQGHGHFVNFGHPFIDLLTAPKTYIPHWFTKHHWLENIRIFQSGFLPAHIALEVFEVKNITVHVSSRERAALELLHLSPKLYAFEEVRIIMESLGTLRPEVLMELLKNCSSEKVKRLLLYFGESLEHFWRKHLDEKQIITSSSLLKIVPTAGSYNSKYNLFLPAEYMIKNDPDIKF